MSIALTNRIAELERTVREQGERLEHLVRQMAGAVIVDAPIASPLEDMKKLAEEINQPKPAAKLCPKCNKVPAKFFHTRSCQGV
jgi:hypothetical protein